MKKAFLLLCALLLALGSALPLAGYRLARAVLGRRADVPPAPASSISAVSEAAPAAFEGDADIFLIEDLSTGEVQQVPKRDYLIGAAAAEMPLTWPDEALKAQIVSAHSYALYCRDHASAANGSWLSADPARRQGYLTDAVLHSYWGTDYEANYARLSALADAVLSDVLCYDGAAAGTSYFAISNGRTEASENVWGSALPYLVPVDSSTDLSADNYEVTLTLSAPQVQQLLSSGLGISADSAAPERWFGETTLTASGYAASLPVCGQTVSGTALRRALGLRSACFNIRYQDGSFRITTKGYGHGVGLSQWGAKALAEQGWTYEAILAHYSRGRSSADDTKTGWSALPTTLCLFILGKLSPEASSTAPSSSRSQPQLHSRLPQPPPLRSPERADPASCRRGPAPSSRSRCCWRCRKR